MKKILLSFLPLIAGATLAAQSSLEVRDMNGTVVTGSVIQYWVAAGGSTHTSDFDFYNIGNLTTTYKVTKTNLTIDPGASSWFCVFHNGSQSDPQSHCYLPATTTTSHTFTTDPGEFNMLQCDFAPGTNTSTSVVHYVMFDINNPADSAGITLVYNVTPAGIASLHDAANLVGEPYPNPSAGIFNFSCGLPENEIIMVTVHGLQGEIVQMEMLTVSGGTVRFDLSAISSGIYVCRFTAKDGTFVSKRISILN